MSEKVNVNGGVLYERTTWVEMAPGAFYPWIQQDDPTAIEVKAVAIVHTVPSGLGAVADGVALDMPGMVVLLTRQENAAHNGLWVTQEGPWTRLPTPPAAPPRP